MLLYNNFLQNLELILPLMKMITELESQSKKVYLPNNVNFVIKTHPFVFLLTEILQYSCLGKLDILILNGKYTCEYEKALFGGIPKTFTRLIN